MGQQAEPFSPEDITPRRRWYVIAAVVAVVGLVIGCGAFFASWRIFAAAMPDADRTFPSGQSTQVQLEAGDEQVVYVQLAYDTGPNEKTPPNNTTCTAGPGLNLSKVSVDITLADGTSKRMWQAVYTVEANTAGSYELQCEQTDGTRVTYGFGDMPWGGAFFAAAGSFVFVIGLPCLCVLAAVVIVVVVAVKRRGSRKRLMS